MFRPETAEPRDMFRVACPWVASPKLHGTQKGTRFSLDVGLGTPLVRVLDRVPRQGP